MPETETTPGEHAPATPNTIVRETLRVQIAARWAPAESLSIALDVYSVPGADQGALLICVPGGGVNRGYYDMKLETPGALSFAEEMASRGHVVAAIDPPGVGESTRPEDGFLLTTDAVVECLHLTLKRLCAERPKWNDLPMIAVGHSAGAMLLALQQARYRDFGGMMLTCFSTSGLPEYLSEAERAAMAAPDRGRAQLADLARLRFGGQAYTDITFKPSLNKGGEPLRRVLDKVLTIVALQAMTPGNIVAELGQIDVPVMLAVGERDMTGPPHKIPANFTACRDLYLHVVPTSGHHIFLAATAPLFYERAGRWLSGFVKE